MTERTDSDEFLDESSSLWRITAGPLVWAAHFLFCYVGAAVWCAKVGANLAFLRLSILGLTVLALAVIAYIGWQAFTREVPTAELHRPRHRHMFLQRAALLLAIISAIAVVFGAMPALFIETCR